MTRSTLVALILWTGFSARAQDFKALEQKVTDFTLPNGFRFVIAERHDAPSISFVTHVGAGVANDSPGLTGLAQLFERLAWKGTDAIGTRDAAAEKKVLDAIEDAYTRLDQERAKGKLANDLDLIRLEREAQSATSQAQGFVVPDELRGILEGYGAMNLAAQVAADSTEFQMALPSNRAELWFLLESQRISRPVFRDFYRERDEAVLEFRSRIGTDATSRLLQALAAAAFTTHPYRNPAFGWPEELSQLRHSDARKFHDRYYVPPNITIGIAGDLRADEARRLAEKYFGPIPRRPLPAASRIQEPPQTGPRTVVVENSAEARLGLAFKRPDEFDRDDPVLEVIRSLLAGNRDSMLPRELLDARRSAGSISSLSSFPGGRSPSLFAILVNALPGHTAEENEKAVLDVVARLQSEPVDDIALARAKAHIRAGLIRRLADNSSIASILARYAAEYGDWRKAFAAVEAVSKVTAASVQVAALKYFAPSRRTTVLMTQPAPTGIEASKGAAK